MALCRAIFITLAAATTASAQAHSYTKSEIEDGMRLYRTTCISCHGSEGASISGIDLGHGKFRHVSSDEEIADVIVNGVPGTGMPAATISRPRSFAIVAYIRSMSDPAGRKSIAAKSGSAIRGKALFENQARCSACHRIRGQGGRSGPDLTEAGLNLRAIEIETAILEPGAGDFFRAQPIRIVPKSGPAVTGLLLNQDSYTLQIQDDQGNLRSFRRSELAECAPVNSPMPSYKGKLNAQELADIIAYVSAQVGPR
jgi:putative heme-binding domain-containing protein